MGKLNDSLLSGSTGRTGRLVVANVSGTEILRVRPRKRTTPPTPKQALIQLRVKKAYDFILPYKAYASAYFGMRVGMRSCYNLAITNIINAYKLNFITMELNLIPSEVEFSHGSHLGAVPTGLSAATAGSFDIEWYNNSGGDQDKESDQLQVLYLAEGEYKPIFLENLAQRIDASATIPVAPNLQGKMIQVWIAFRTVDLMMASTSSYVGNVQLL